MSDKTDDGARQQLQPQAPIRPQTRSPVGQPVARGQDGRQLAGVQGAGTRQRRWTLDMMQLFGLRSAVATERVLANSIAVAERVDRATFQPNEGTNCASYLRDANLIPGPSFKEYLKQLEAFEKLEPPRTAKQAAALKTAAQDAVRAYGNLRKPLLGKGRQDSVREQAKLKICEETLAQLEAYDLKAELQQLARNKPLDSAAAMRAAAAGAKLDLLSLPPGKQQAKPLDGADKGVNATYWINKTGAEGASTGSFVCKPMLKAEDVAGDGAGIPPAGGEVAREALVGRAGEMLRNLLNLDIEVPETHVVSLGKQFFPEDRRDRFDGPGGNITASVQEVRKNDGPMGRLSQADRAQIPKSKSHALAIMDMVTLNADRHGGNLLMDNGLPVPIDHGLSMCDPTKDNGAGLRRVAQTMATDHNILLSLPSAHEPMDPTMIEGLKRLAPKSVRDMLRQERDTVVKAEPAMAGKVTDEALEPPRRAVKFLQLAALKAPNLSPATLQVAMGKNAPVLFAPNLDERGFNQCAERILADIAKDQDVIKEVCLLNGAESAALNAELAALGWEGKNRYSPPYNSISTDPALAMKIAAAGMRADDPVDLKLQNESDVAATEHAKILDEIRKDQKGIYNPSYMVVDAAKQPSWNPAAEYKAHRALMSLPPEKVVEVKTLNLVKGFPPTYTPTRLLTEVRRLEVVRARAKQNEDLVGGDPWLGMRPKLIEIKKKAADALAGYLPDGEQAAAIQGVRQAEQAPDSLDALSQVSADLLAEIQARLYAAADRIEDPDGRKGVRDATMAGDIPQALDYLKSAGQKWQ